MSPGLNRTLVSGVDRQNVSQAKGKAQALKPKDLSLIPALSLAGCHRNSLSLFPPLQVSFVFSNGSFYFILLMYS